MGTRNRKTTLIASVLLAAIIGATSAIAAEATTGFIEWLRQETPLRIIPLIYGQRGSVIISEVHIQIVRQINPQTGQNFCGMRVQFRGNNIPEKEYVWPVVRTTDDPIERVFPASWPETDGEGRFVAWIVLGPYSAFELQVVQVGISGKEQIEEYRSERLNDGNWGRGIPRPIQGDPLIRFRDTVMIDPISCLIIQK